MPRAFASKEKRTKRGLSATKMTLVNCIVVSANQNKVIYPWKITHATDDSISIREFFLRNIRNSLDNGHDGALVKAYLGKSKDSLDLIDLDIDLKSSVISFGPFIKLTMEAKNHKSQVLSVLLDVHFKF